MAYLGSENIKKLITEKNVISPQPEDFSRVKNGAYELSLGSEIFRTDSKDRKKEILKEEKELITINPGQFALLLTMESVSIPFDKIAFISIKAGVKLRGLINVSGFHVDPGFRGNLLFSVYNAGSSPISLEKGEPYFLIWFAELKLDENEVDIYNGDHKNQNSISPKYIDSLIGGELASPNILLEKINDNFKSLDAKATTREYIMKTGIGILIVIALKILIDWGIYERGTSDGYRSKLEEIKLEKEKNKLLVQNKILLLKIDSIQRAHQKTENR